MTAQIYSITPDIEICGAAILFDNNDHQTILTGNLHDANDWVDNNTPDKDVTMYCVCKIGRHKGLWLYKGKNNYERLNSDWRLARPSEFLTAQIYDLEEM